MLYRSKTIGLLLLIGLLAGCAGLGQQQEKVEIKLTEEYCANLCYTCDGLEGNRRIERLCLDRYYGGHNY